MSWSAESFQGPGLACRTVEVCFPRKPIYVVHGVASQGRCLLSTAPSKDAMTGMWSSHRSPNGRMSYVIEALMRGKAGRKCGSHSSPLLFVIRAVASANQISCWTPSSECDGLMACSGSSRMVCGDGRPTQEGCVRP